MKERYQNIHLYLVCGEDTTKGSLEINGQVIFQKRRDYSSHPYKISKGILEVDLTSSKSNSALEIEKEEINKLEQIIDELKKRTLFEKPEKITKTRRIRRYDPADEPTRMYKHIVKFNLPKKKKETLEEPRPAKTSKLFFTKRKS